MVGDPGENPEYTQGGAPAGETFGGDLPVTSVPGGNPATTNGYSPDPTQDKLPAPGSTDGDGLPPTGIRR